MTELARWESFYGIVGSAAGTLIGLQFVVMTLIAVRPIRAPELGAAFGTPTVVHFSAALLLSAVLRAPWQNIAVVADFWGLIGFSGVAYVVIVAWRMGKQTRHKPEFEDWFFHIALPLAAYAALVASAFPVRSHAREALFGVGAAALLLLFAGIHNAWDAVAYHVFVVMPDRTSPRLPDETSETEAQETEER